MKTKSLFSRLLLCGVLLSSAMSAQTTSYAKIIKSSGGQGYAEDAQGNPTGGISIQEDRGPDGKLRLTAISNNWSQQGTSLVWYLYTTAGSFDLDLITKVNTGKNLSFEFSITDINNLGLTAEKCTVNLLGKGVSDTTALKGFTAAKTGFYRYELKPLSNPANSIEVQGLLFKAKENAQADVHATNYLSSPSVHLSNWRSTQSVPAGTKYDWCYQEILVPEGGDALNTYYMSLGVLSGYMGIQTNSPTERRILFSMWDNGSTEEDPNLPDHLKAGFVDYNPNVTVKRFGGEGTGMQSFVNGWNWNTGVPVKFLTNSRLEQFYDTLKNQSGQDSVVLRKNTIVTAWYNSDPAKGWQYISTLRMPNQVKYFDSWYSFLENFGFSNGQVKRFAYYYNAFAHIQSSNPDQPGLWRHFNQVNFGNTDGAAGQRVDFEQGVAPDKEGAFYMSTGGYGKMVKTASQVPLMQDRSVVESLDLAAFKARVDEALAKEKARTDSIKAIQNNLITTKNGWKIIAKSSEETSGEGSTNGRAACIIDNNPATYWHSQWTGSGSSFPHSFTIQMDQVYPVTGLMFTLSGGSSRYMKDIQIYGSANGLTGYELLHSVTCPDSEKFYIPLPQTASIRGFKVVIKNSQTGEVHCRVNEIDVTVQQTTGLPQVGKPTATASLFPNPAREQCYVSLPRAAKQVKLQLLDAQGKLCKQLQFANVEALQVMECPTQELPHGLYTLRIQADRKVESKRLLVQP